MQSENGQNLKNPAAVQRSSPQGCTVRAKAAPDRARYGVFSVQCLLQQEETGLRFQTQNPSSRPKLNFSWVQHMRLLQNN
jgi:hypothetical protein